MRYVAVLAALLIATPALASHGDQSIKFGGYCLHKSRHAWPWWAVVDVNFKGECPPRH